MITAQQYRTYAENPAEFRKNLVIEAAGKRRWLGEVLEPWQRADFAATDAGWAQAVGRPHAEEEPIKRVYLERPRGHSKTSDLAVMCLWSLTFTRKPLRGYAAAAARWQARHLRNAIHKLLRLNPWLQACLRVNNYVVSNVARQHPGQGSELEIISSESGSSYGIEPDFVICDELTHWPGDGAIWESLASAAAKKTTCMLVIISNAGALMGDSWQWKIREQAREGDRWHFSRLDGPQAAWISQEDLEEQRLLLPGKAFMRLWMNCWTAGGDALDGTDVEACVTLDGPFSPYPGDGIQSGSEMVGGLDLGVKRDHAAFVGLVADRREHRVRLNDCKSWKPKETGGEVDLIAVENYVLEAHKRLKFKSIWYDPHEAALMAQRLRRHSVPMKELRFVGRNLDTMASALLEAVRSRSLDLYRDQELIHDLLRLNIVQKQFGFKLEAARDATTGHADRAIALAIALPDALERSQWKHRSAMLPVGRSGKR